MTYRDAAALLALSLWAFSATALARTEVATPEPDTAVEATEPEAIPAADQPERELGFDPALIGLPGFPLAPATEEDFDLALELIAARIAELQARGTGEEAEPAAQRSTEPTPATQQPGPDPRIERLSELRDAMQRGATIARRLAQIDAAIAEQQALLAALEREGLAQEPPYSIALLDQLRAERSLASHTETMADRSQEQAQRRATTTARNLEEAMRTRRQLRDRSAQDDQEAGTADHGEALEIARLDTLVAFQRHQVALAEQIAAQKRETLAAAQLALAKARIARIGDDVVFTSEALDERLAEVQSREAALQTRLDALSRAGARRAGRRAGQRPRSDALPGRTAQVRSGAKGTATVSCATAARDGGASRRLVGQRAVRLSR